MKAQQIRFWSYSRSGESPQVELRMLLEKMIQDDDEIIAVIPTLYMTGKVNGVPAQLIDQATIIYK